MIPSIERSPQGQRREWMVRLSSRLPLDEWIRGNRPPIKPVAWDGDVQGIVCYIDQPLRVVESRVGYSRHYQVPDSWRNQEFDYHLIQAERLASSLAVVVVDRDGEALDRLECSSLKHAEHGRYACKNPVVVTWDGTTWTLTHYSSDRHDAYIEVKEAQCKFASHQALFNRHPQFMTAVRHLLEELDSGKAQRFCRQVTTCA